MLVLTRKTDEAVRIGEDVVITILDAGSGRVRLGIEAPPEIEILREELVEDETIAHD